MYMLVHKHFRLLVVGTVVEMDTLVAEVEQQM